MADKPINLFLYRIERSEREARERQVWAHNHIFDKELGEEARAIHDWNVCPECDFIDGGSRHEGGAKGKLHRPRTKDRLTAKEAARYDRKVAKRRAARRERRRAHLPDESR